MNDELGKKKFFSCFFSRMPELDPPTIPFETPPKTVGDGRPLSNFKDFMTAGKSSSSYNAQQLFEGFFQVDIDTPNPISNISYVAYMKNKIVNSGDGTVFDCHRYFKTGACMCCPHFTDTKIKSGIRSVKVGALQFTRWECRSIRCKQKKIIKPKNQTNRKLPI